jgi:hypothetical protein
LASYPIKNKLQRIIKMQDEIFSRVLKAGKRTYFFDVRETRAGDYYLTVTESKRSNNIEEDPSYKKFKIYLYKEDFANFKEILNETTDFIVKEKGDEVISERHQKDYIPAPKEEIKEEPKSSSENSSLNEMDFDNL